MKTRYFLIVATLFLFVWACEKTDNVDEPGDVEEQPINDFLSVYNDYQEVKNYLGTSPKELSTKSLRQKSFSFKCDTDSIGGGTPIDTAWCANVTDTFDYQGNYLLITDYGEEGCIENGKFLKGKVTYIVYADSSNNATKYIYDGFSVDGTELNGEILSEYYFYGDSLQDHMKTTEDILITFVNGESVNITGFTKSKWVLNGYSKFEAEYIINSSKGYVIKYEIIHPLYYDYSCDIPGYIPVMGVEKVIYKVKKARKFEIDYGDGTCDYLITIKTKGKRIEVDLSDSSTWVGPNVPDSLFTGN